MERPLCSSDLRFGTSRSRGRSLNCINMSDTNDLDEWGGGLIYSETALDGALPFKLYAIFKRTESHTTKSPAPRNRPAREISCLGLWAEPQLTDIWSAEFETARQFGRILDGNRQAGGWMVHGEIKCRPGFLESVKGVLSSALTYYSGDRHKTGECDNDTSWDPMWARYTQDSEMLVYGSLYENCWWSNMIYAKAKLAMTFGPRHAMYFLHTSSAGSSTSSSDAHERHPKTITIPEISPSITSFVIDESCANKKMSEEF